MVLTDGDMQKRVYVLYGSQTGNAEYIAKDLHEKLEDSKIESECLQLNKVKNVDLKKLASLLVVVCSTTGNGDAPENCEAFWRHVKLRARPTDTFSGLPYMVLGLGDTNYDKFCYMGKAIDKRLSELGGDRVLELHCADEATGLEEVVEAWKARAFDLIRQRCTMSSNAADSDATEDISDDASHTGSEQSAHHAIIPDGLKSVFDVCVAQELPHSFADPPPANLVPRLRTNGNSTYPIQCTVQSSEKESAAAPDTTTSMYTVDHPYMASIIGAKELCRPSKTNDKHILQLDISISDAHTTYKPGDAVAICCPNPPEAVAFVLSRLRYEGDAEHRYALDTTIERSSGEFVTLGDILGYKIDLVGPLRKPMVAQLSPYCSSEKERNILQWVCSKGPVGKVLWEHFIEKQGVGIVELLALFPSCSPPLSALINIANPLPPRSYSITTSPLQSPSIISIVYSVVRFKTADVTRHGLCTTYLTKLVTPLLNTSSPPSQLPKVRLIFKPTQSFHLPASLSPPLILIGPGTGVAPFMGFLAHREELVKNRPGEETCGMWRGYEFDAKDDLPAEPTRLGECCCHTAGDAYLFFGCRNHEDWIFKDEMNRHLEQGNLRRLEVALSRIQKDKVYVTHKMQLHGKELARHILENNAYVYVCGDGSEMSKDVTTTLAQILCQYGDMTDAEAKDLLDEMKSRRRFVLDIWSC